VNRNLEDAFGKRIIEKLGKKWAFTDFGVEIWGKTEEDEVEFPSGDRNGSQGRFARA